MIRGLYTSAWSMLANSKQMDVISNNLANVNTNAYKKDTVVLESFPSVLTSRINDTKSNTNPSGQVGKMELSSDVGEVFTYYKQGQLVNTDSKLDLAFQGTDTAFFTVEVADADGNAKQYYTRDGGFAINANGRLVTKEGYPVMGQSGPITLNGGSFEVQADGTIVQNGKVVDKLLIKDFEDTSTLRKFGSNLVEDIGNSEGRTFTGTVTQGFVEQSNVNIIKEMVDMITVTRSYEANQKIIQALDSTLEKAVNQVGSIR